MASWASSARDSTRLDLDSSPGTKVCRVWGLGQAQGRWFAGSGVWDLFRVLLLCETSSSGVFAIVKFRIMLSDVVGMHSLVSWQSVWDGVQDGWRSQRAALHMSLLSVVRIASAPPSEVREEGRGANSAQAATCLGHGRYHRYHEL